MQALNGLLQNIVTGLRLIGGTVVLGSLIWAGILWMTSAGNPRQLESARAAFLAAIIGFAIVVFAPQIAAIVTNVAGT